MLELWLSSYVAVRLCGAPLSTPGVRLLGVIKDSEM